MIWSLGVRIARISGLLTKTSSGAYAAETAKIPGNGTRSSLFYIVQKSPLTLSPGVPTPWVDGSIARPALQRRVRRRLSPPAKSHANHRFLSCEPSLSASLQNGLCGVRADVGAQPARHHELHLPRAPRRGNLPVQ